MKHKDPYRAVATLGVGFFLVVTALSAQESPSRPHIGVPQDWSQHHIVFSRDALLQHPNLIYQEPRIRHRLVQRWQDPNASVAHGSETTDTASTSPSVQRDWSATLGFRISANMSPAKFSFDPAAPPSCANDYVVFGLATAGTPKKANLVAFNNLYAGMCATPHTVMFAYNVTTVTSGPGGKILTSPVLSEDGTKIAFVESVTGATPSAIFHVLNWKAGQGTLVPAAAAVPTTCTTPTIPGCMTSTTFSPAATSTTSSPWVDYSGDIAYLGADDGRVYQITGVFKGTPTLAGAPWPVLVGTNVHMTSPVLDKGRGLLMVGGSNGNLYQINTTTGAVVPLAVGRGGRTNPGIRGEPIVDVTNGTTFVVSANDGTSGVLVEADTATNTQLVKVRIGLASANAAHTAVSLYEPDFSDSYYTDPSTGLIRLCGTGATDITPYQYAFGFSGITLQTTPSFMQQLLTSTTARCTGWTEFFNPNVNGGTDFFFFGLTAECTGPLTSGCVVARSSDTTLTMAPIAGGPSGIVVDNYDPAGSNIYFMAEGANTAYQLTQNGLQ